MVFSKTREGAKVPSREANYLEFELDSKDISVGNRAPYGSPSLKQTQHGIWYPTIQAAIDDVRAMTTETIGEIKITTGTNPTPVQQITRITINGVCNLTPGSDEYLSILGLKVKMVNGDTGPTTAAKWKAIADGLAASAIAMENIQISGSTQNIIDVKHLDYQNHEFTGFRWNGIEVSFAVQSVPRAGYGNWQLIGSEDKNLGGVVTKMTYWQRMS